MIPNNKMKRDVDLNGLRRRARIIIATCMILITYSFYAPDYKEKNWLALAEWPVQKIGMSDTEHVFNTTYYLVSFPFKAFRAHVVLMSFKFKYAWFDDVEQELEPLRFGAYVLQFSAQDLPTDMIVPARMATAILDVDNDGHRDHISWVNKKGAILFLDKNKNNRLDNGSELLGVDDVSLWRGLRSLDANGDKVLDDNDPAFNDLKLLWNKDGSHALDGRGVSRFSRLVDTVSLSNISLVRKDKASKKVLHWKGDNVRVDRVVYFSMSVPVMLKNGTRKNLFIMFFDENEKPTRQDKRAAYSSLPNLRGHGMLLNLHAEIRIDPDLEGIVRKFSMRKADDLFFQFENTDRDVRDVLFRWAKTDEVDADGRGWFIDGRKLSYLEMFMGERFAQLGKFFNPMPYAANHLKFSWSTAFRRQRALLMLQSDAGKKLFGNHFYYNYVTEKVSRDAMMLPDYLDYLVVKSQHLSKEDRRKLLEVVTDMLDVVIVIYPRRKSEKPQVITRSQMDFRDKQLALLIDFRGKLFP